MINREPQTVEEEREKWVSHIPKIYQAVYRKAMKGKSLRAALNAKCQDCTNWQRTEITNCPVVTCPCHPHRPYQSKKSPPSEGVLEKNSLIVGKTILAAQKALNHG